MVDSRVWDRACFKPIVDYLESNSSAPVIQDFIAKAVKFLMAVLMNHNEKASKRDKVLASK